MLQKKYRLKKYSAILATYRVNDVISDKNICIYFGRKKTDENSPVKIAFVVSKKIHKRAVVRNRIKRLMRENFRLIMKNNEFPFINDYISIICVAKKGSLDAVYSDVNKSVNNLLAGKNKV